MRATDDPLEDRLDVVIGVMARGDGGGTQSLGGPGEKLVPDGPGGRLDAHRFLGCHRGHVDGLDDARQVPLLGKVANKSGVGVGIGAQAVVEMGHRKLPASVGAGGKFTQHRQQRHAVAPAADGHDNGLPGQDKLPPVDERLDIADKLIRRLRLPGRLGCGVRFVHGWIGSLLAGATLVYYHVLTSGETLV